MQPGGLAFEEPKSPIRKLTQTPARFAGLGLQLLEAVKEAASIRKQSRRHSNHKPRRLTLPELDQSKTSVLNTLGSLQPRRSYPRAMDEFIAWYCSEPRLALNEALSSVIACTWIASPRPRSHEPSARCSAYLSQEDLAEILAQPDLRTPAGRKDVVLLSVLYDTGAHVHEFIDLSVGDVRLDPPAQVPLLGLTRGGRLQTSRRLVRRALHR